MKYIKAAALILLLVMVFVSMDLGINCLGVLVPELQDGIPYNSVLQSAFGLLDALDIDTRPEFLYALQKSLLMTYGLLILNVALAFCKKKK